jgi:cytochrome oxidase Cu insertion factor (SCO1/SenC/PrrC family)
MRPRALLVAGGLLIAAVGAGVGIGLTHDSTSSPLSTGSTRAHSPAGEGWPFHRVVPASPLTTAQGVSLSLRALRGKVVVLAPSLTLCHEICPLTTQAFVAMQHELARQGLAGEVAFVEATVDPWRDSPARLRAYARLSGAHFIQLTGGVAQMRRFWNYLGIGFRRVPQGNPPDRDWWTQRPETFDVEHVDGVFLIDANGYERVFYPGIADTAGHLAPALRRLMSKEGLSNLAHPQNAWTEPQVMVGIARLLGSSGSGRS